MLVYLRDESIGESVIVVLLVSPSKSIQQLDRTTAEEPTAVYN